MVPYTARFAPIPNASESTAVTVVTRPLTSRRTARRKSLKIPTMARFPRYAGFSQPVFNKSFHKRASGRMRSMLWSEGLHIIPGTLVIYSAPLWCAPFGSYTREARTFALLSQIDHRFVGPQVQTEPFHYLPHPLQRSSGL